MIPDMKIILILRRPNRRATSEFLHHCRHTRYFVLKSNVSINCPSYGMYDADKLRKSNYSEYIHILKGTIVNRFHLHECNLYNPKSQELYKYHSNFNSLFQSIKYPCKASHFKEYYFGYTDNMSPSVLSTSISNLWAAEEYSHGNYYTQIKDALNMYVEFTW